MLKKENLNLKFFPLKKIYFAPEEFQNFKLQKAVINICIIVLKIIRYLIVITDHENI